MRILVNGTEIGQELLEETIHLFHGRHNIFEEKREETPETIRQRAIDYLIGHTLVDQYLLSSSCRYPEPSEKRIQTALRQEPDYFARFSPEEAHRQAVFFIKQGMLDKELKAKVPPLAEEECRRVYESHPDVFIQQEGYMASTVDYYLDKDHALSASEATIALLQLKTAIEASEHPNTSWFSAIIKESDSYDPDESNSCFQILFKKDLPEEIAGKLDRAREGEICGPFFRDIDTVTLLRLEQKISQAPISFEKAKGVILKAWHQHQRTLLFNAFAATLREGAKIECIEE